MTRAYIIQSTSPLEDFRAAAAAAGLLQAAAFPANDSLGHQEGWSNDARSVAVQYVDEPKLELQYFFLLGDPTLRAYLMASLFNSLDYIGPEMVLDEAIQAKTIDQLIVSCNRLAVISVEYDPNVFNLLKRLTTHEDHVVRTAATRALVYRRWPESHPLLRTLAAHDPSEWVRGAAQRGMDAIRSSQGS